MVILEVPDGVYEVSERVYSLSFVSIFNLLLNLNDMDLQYNKLVTKVDDGMHGEYTLNEKNKTDVFNINFHVQMMYKYIQIIKQYK